MAAKKQPNWRPFPMTTPRNHANSVSLDPNPVSSRMKTSRILGKGTGESRATDKGVSR